MSDTGGEPSFSLDFDMLAGLLDMFGGMFGDMGETGGNDNALTPDGNMTLIDDIGSSEESGKQFITVQTKNGNVFYLIIDRDDEGEYTVHFSKMSRRYEDEQKEISERIKTLRAEMDKLSSKAVTADMFISTVRKYTRAKALTPRMLNELIDRIEVHQAEKIDGEWVQHLTIHYNCVGAIFIPEVFPLPVPEVSVNTRKGVVVNYAPCQIAI